MGIRIEWVDPNQANAPVSIYRSENKMLDDNNLPEPIAVVPSNTGFYLDEDIIRNKLYYYRVATPGVEGSGELVITPNKGLMFMPYTGPGPKNIIRGDYEFGIFGRMPMGNLFSAQELVSWSGIDVITETVPGIPNEWVKFIHKGKIYFTPTMPIATKVSWLSLYNAGLVYGEIPKVEWPPLVKDTYPFVPQNKTISLREHLFGVRFPTSRKNSQSTAGDQASLIGGEWDQFIASLYVVRTFPDANGNPQLDDNGNPPYASFTTDVSVAGCLNRGYSTAGDSTFNSLPSGTTDAVNGWRPLLTLIL
jgi:hypothetical protein